MESLWALTETTALSTPQHRKSFEWRYRGNSVAGFFTSEDMAERFALTEPELLAGDSVKLEPVPLATAASMITSLIRGSTQFVAMNPESRQKLTCLTPDVFLLDLLGHLYEAGVDDSRD